MDNKDLIFGDGGADQQKKTDHSQQQPQMRRELDSLDDFEHLSHLDDHSPNGSQRKDNVVFAGDGAIARDKNHHHRHEQQQIDSDRVETTGRKITDIDDDFNHQQHLSSFDPLTSGENSKKLTMDSNLFEMGDSKTGADTSDKLDKFMEEMSSFAPPSSKQDNQPENPNKALLDFGDDNDDFVGATQKFMAEEAKHEFHHNDEDDELIQASKNELNVSNEQLERYSDVSDEMEEIVEQSPKKQLPDFKDLDDDFLPSQPELPKKDYPSPSAPPPSTVTTVEEPVIAICPAKPETDRKTSKKSNVIDAEAIFCKMGLDTWFNPERLNPKVESLIYWRDPKKSGPVFGGVLLVLLSLTYFSLISVVAYLSLLGLTGTISFRIYKNIVQAVQKTGDGHPFKDLLEFDVALPQDKVKEVSEVAVAHINAGVAELRRLFLVEDLIDSIKFGVLLWALTYLGAWFNGMTLIILAWVALFSLPKVYETNKTQIDANLEIVRTKLAEITSKVKAAIPIGKKPEVEKKEQ